MDDIQKLAAEAALKNMVKQGRFSICVIDGILRLTQSVPDKVAYNTLALLHCVDFSDMADTVRNEVPNLIRRVIGGDQINMKEVFDLVHEVKVRIVSEESGGPRKMLS